jgi:oligosaccharide 4-alpha-D-glucosyltransferase
MKALSKIIVMFITAAFCGLPAASGRDFRSVQQTASGFDVSVSDGTIQFTMFSPNTLQVEFIATDKVNPPSYAVSASPGKIKASFIETPDMIKYVTSELSVHIRKNPFTISYSFRNKPLISEESGYFDKDTLRGFRFNLTPDEKLMGGGSRVLGMNRRGQRLQLYNRASYGFETHAPLMYYSMPVVISSKKYMLVFDNGASGFMDLGATEPGILQFEAVGGRMSYLIVAAEEWPLLTEHFTDLTGRQPMLPRWALGNIASRMGYHNSREVEAVVDKYIHDDIPLDAIVLDIYWFGPELKGYMGNLEWDLDSFPQPRQMMANVKSKGVKTILVTEPFILKQTGKFNECAEQGLFGTRPDGQPYIFDFFFGTTALLDIFKPETQKWFWGIYKKHTLTGVDGWWGDLGEPEVHPDDLLHVNGRADNVHNLYGHEWAKMVFEGYERDFPERRPFILMRSGFVGSQRYGLVPWSGDVNRTWGGLQPQVEIALQMGLQGLAWMHSDLGGFAGAYKDSELYTRWLQYGVFQPVYRTHAQQEVPAEPVFWDDTTKNIVRKFIKLRYALMPYNYTLMYENSVKGIPMMRPLFFAEDNDGLIDNQSAYLWGDNFLVSPVVFKQAKKQKVYLPANSAWFDYWTNKKYKGGQEIEVKLQPDQIPVFVKAGSFIPMVPDFQNTEKYNSSQIILHYYFDPAMIDSEGYMYEDDGATPDAWQKQTYEIIRFESEYAKPDGLRINVEPKGYGYKGKPASRTIELVVHALKRRPSFVEVSGDPAGENQHWDASDNTFHVKFSLGSTPEIIVIK